MSVSHRLLLLKSMTISPGADGLVKLWTVKTNECIATYDQHEDKVLKFLCYLFMSIHLKKSITLSPPWNIQLFWINEYKPAQLIWFLTSAIGHLYINIWVIDQRFDECFFPTVVWIWHFHCNWGAKFGSWPVDWRSDSPVSITCSLKWYWNLNDADDWDEKLWGNLKKAWIFILK